MVAGQGLRLVAAGSATGLVAGYAAARSLQSLLAGVTPFDPVAFAATVALAGIPAAAGTLLPAMRAARVDPITAIRTD